MAPPMLAALSMGTSIVGGLMGAQSALAAGRSQQQMGAFQASVALRNAQIAEQNATIADIQGEQTAMRIGMKGRQQAGEIVAQQGASGLDVNSGSAKQVQDSQHLVTSMDMAQIRQNAAKAAYDFGLQSRDLGLQAMMHAAGGNAAMSAARTDALASIVSSSGSVADKWLKGQQVGMWG